MLVWMPIIIVFVSSKNILTALKQDDKVVDQAYLYILSNLFNILLLGLSDLQRKFLIQCSKSHVLLKTQIIGLLVHILGNALFVNYLELGVIGTGFAGVISNTFLLLANIYLTKIEKDLVEAY